MLKMILQLLVTLVSLSLFLSPAISSSTLAPTDTKSWCGRTPHPQPCEYFLSQNPNFFSHSINQEYSDFLKASLELALDHAMQAQAHIQTLGSKCWNEREKAAWADCLVLYEYTIEMLKKTVDPNPNIKPFDVQNWLSTALTNLDTCENGFMELGATNNIMPLILSNNVSALISNSLAINKVSVSCRVQESYIDGFPTWVSPGDRKLLESSSFEPRLNIVVAKDGSGNYQTVNEAIAALRMESTGERYVIQVKEGTYMENVDIDQLKNIMLIGDGIGKTIITGSKCAAGGSTIFTSATFAVVGYGFIARGITFQNTAGPHNGQAVALRSGSEHSVFYQCSFEGYQDTLFVHSNKQFYRNCDIYGTVDFIFGNAAVVFQNCNIYARNPPTKANTITAQGRTNPNQTTGISIHNSKVMAAPDLKPVQGTVRTFLGRPWMNYSRTVFMKTFIDDLIDPSGWLEWNGGLNTLYYGEYMNTGPGSLTSNRVKWDGFHVISSEDEALEFTVSCFIGGDSWLPATNVPFTSCL